ncbi:unnamed protein product [Paramecium primaurelia]|uniref:Uncharacterized protein n=1 Tax=Paramecium primaurelia TaxID=5886 RepID=A0A8S1NEK7_PARPR|nr:unnamed protein product [Paramecium primaurelia]
MLISQSLHQLNKDKEQRDYNQNLNKRTSQELMKGQTNSKNCQLKPSFFQMSPLTK